MATIISPQRHNRQLTVQDALERETLDYLGRHLSAEYTIFDNVFRTGAEGRRYGAFGEIDFIIVNREGAALVIEQKNGPLHERDGDLIKRYVGGERSVTTQIGDSIEIIKHKYRTRHTDAITVSGIIFAPEHRVRAGNALLLDVTRVVDSEGKLPGLAARICQLLPPGRESPKLAKVLEFFAPKASPSLVLDVRSQVRAHYERMTSRSNELADLVTRIDMRPSLKLRLRAVAGSGKSTVAVEAFNAAVRRGKRPLLLCYNRPLAERLRQVLGSGPGRVDTWFGFLRRFLEARGRKPHFKGGVSPDWARLQDEVQEEALLGSLPDDWTFDCVIVDEGQDFEPEWFDLLELFARDGADYLWLEDPDQKLRPTGDVDLVAPKHGFTGLRIKANHRTPKAIANFLQTALPFEFEAANPLLGYPVSVLGYKEIHDQAKLVEGRVNSLLREGFRHEEIVILSLRGIDSATLAKRQGLGSLKFKRFTGEYDADGNQVFTSGQLQLESIRRFKGDQAPAVIVTDVEPDPERLDHHKRLLWCAATRATVRLELVARSGVEGNAPLFEAARKQG